MQSYITKTRRRQLQKLAFERAVKCEAAGEVAEFAKLLTLLERQFQFDDRREEKQPKTTKPASLADRKAAVAGRIKLLKSS